MSNKHRSPGASARHRSSLTTLQPIDSAPFKRPSSLWFVWATVLVLWLLSLLPWRMWQPAPDVLLLVIAFWCLHEPRRINMAVAFVFGLLLDVHDAGLLGEQAPDGVDDGRHRLVLGEPRHGGRHAVGRYERRADERQEDERVRERARTVDGLRRQSRDHGEPSEREGEQEQDAGHGKPFQRARSGAEPEDERDPHDERERDGVGHEGGQYGASFPRGVHAGARPLSLFDAVRDQLWSLSGEGHSETRGVA